MMATTWVRIMRTLCMLLALSMVGAVHAGQWAADGKFKNGYGERTYKLWVPTGYTVGRPMPLLMVLHGCSSSGQKIAEVTRFNELADREGVVVVYPNQSIWGSITLCWNWGNGSQQVRDDGEPSMLMGILRQVAATYGTDPHRQYVAGFSAGAGMVAILAACNADSFAAAAIHSGGMFKAATNITQWYSAMSNGSSASPDATGIDAWRCSLAPTKSMPVVVIHGSDDPTVNAVNGGQAARQFAQFNDMADDGSDNDTVPSGAVRITSFPAAVPGGYPFEVSDYMNSAGQLLVQHVRVLGLKHFWSGGAATEGRDAEPLGPDATALVWNFFRTRSK